MPETKLLLPKFLTKETAEEAILVAAKTVLTPPISLDIKRQDFHIVVLVPKMVVEAGNYPNYPINPHLLAEYSQGDKKLWSRDYANIAQCKAIQRWYDRADGGTDTRPHLLF